MLLDLHAGFRGRGWRIPLIVGALKLAVPNAAAQLCGGEWLPSFSIAGADDDVFVVAQWDPDGPGPVGARVVIGGSMRVAGDVVANGVAVWDPAARTFAALGSGPIVSPYTVVRQLASYTDGALVAALVQPTGGEPRPAILRRWDGQSWSAIPFETRSTLPILCVHAASNGDLIVGGGFNWNLPDGTTARNIVRWDGQRWSSLGDGFNGRVRALRANAEGGIIAAGEFGRSGATTVRQVARWDGQAWQPLGAGLNGAVSALLIASDGALVAGGAFSGRVARWDGASWSVLGAGLSTQVNGLAELPGGRIVAARNTSIDVFDGASWAKPSMSLVNDGTVTSVNCVGTSPTGELIVGMGSTMTCGARNVARWDGESWSPLDPAAAFDVVGVAERRPGELIVVGGPFWSADGAMIQHVARLTEAGFSPLGSGIEPGTVNHAHAYAAARLPNNDVLVGGDFDLAGGRLVRAIARWDGAEWSPLGTGLTPFIVPPIVNVIEVLADGSAIVGGTFSGADDVASTSIIRWDGAAWTPLRGGMAQTDGSIFPIVYALAAMPNGDLIAGGNFTHAGAQPAARIARWDGSRWYALGGGVNGVVNAIVAMPSGDVLAGGQFTAASGAPAKSLARWDGAAWTAFDHGLASASKTASLTRLSNGDIVATGVYVLAPQGEAVRAIRWNGSRWVRYGSEIATGAVNRIVERSDGAILAAGNFSLVQTPAGGTLARFAGTSTPTICTHPEPQNVCRHRTFSPFVEAAGDEPLSYQWRRNGVDLEDGVDGASGTQTPALTLTDVDFDDVGAYACVVSNPFGVAVSFAAPVGICTGDVNFDGRIDTADLAALLRSFGTAVDSESQGDLDDDGSVDLTDLALLLKCFGRICAP